MKLTNEQVCDSYVALSNLKNSKKLLPIKVSYAIIRNIKLLQPIVESVDMVKLDIFSKYGTQDTNSPGSYDIPPENVVIVNDQLRELSATENEVNIITIKLDTLDGYELTVDEMDALYFMIEESEE